VTNWPLFVSIFLACAVEAVEATTIVLAAGTARDWRSSLQGVGVALGGLSLIILILGPAISLIPIGALRLIVGVLLLWFGLSWLRKAVLRAAGRKALHDEAAIYQLELAAARSAKAGKRFAVHDWYAFTLSFKGVFLEGIEVVFIVISFGGLQSKLFLASMAALSAVVIVAIAGVILRQPMARVPENTMKYFVGAVLTSFGIFWGAEGLGYNWPHGDSALLLIFPLVFIVSWGFVIRLRSTKVLN
jgi:uncharacterized membrane protein